MAPIEWMQFYVRAGALENKFYDEMHPRNKHYLTKIADEMQYMAARCAMDPSICMYDKSTSSGVESTIRANSVAGKKAEVDFLNAVILILKLDLIGIMCSQNVEGI